MTIWAWLWILWIGCGVALEVVALSRKAKGDTLSEQVWWLFSHPTFGRFAMYISGAFLIWLCVHFLTKGKYA